MRKLLSVLALMFLLGSTASCYRHSYGQFEAPGPSTHAKWTHNVLWGFLSVNGHTDASVCAGAPPVRMATYVGPVGLLLGIVTAGIYVPTTTRVWCGRPPIGDNEERADPDTETASR